MPTIFIIMHTNDMGWFAHFWSQISADHVLFAVLSTCRTETCWKHSRKKTSSRYVGALLPMQNRGDGKKAGSLYYKTLRHKTWHLNLNPLQEPPGFLSMLMRFAKHQVDWATDQNRRSISPSECPETFAASAIFPRTWIRGSILGQFDKSLLL